MMRLQGFRLNQKPDWIYVLSVMGLAVLSNQIFYQGGRLLSFWLPHRSLALPWDVVIPLLPWTLSVYIGCFAFWLFQYFLCALQSRQESDRFFSALILGKCFCVLIYVLLPTSMARPDVTGDGLWEMFLRWLYRLDSPDNLFPSLHCVVAWICWVGVRGKKEFPLPHRSFSLLMALAVCLSTLTTKQHVIADVFGGIAVAELSYWLTGKEKIRMPYSRLIDRIMEKLRRARQTRISQKEQKK